MAIKRDGSGTKGLNASLNSMGTGTAVKKTKKKSKPVTKVTSDKSKSKWFK